jgi:hypothetical protein
VKQRVATDAHVRSILRGESFLLGLLNDGLGAVKRAHRVYFEDAVKGAFVDSLDLDKAMEAGHANENRWDYLLGHSPSSSVVAVEPHSARDDQISTVINKKRAAEEQLRGHLVDGAKVRKWLWVASGTVDFARTEIAQRRLDQNGIQFAGKQIKSKHLA